MEYEALMALIQDAGGYGNIIRFIFDNNIHVNFSLVPKETTLKKEDFVNLGGSWFYKEPTTFRNNRDYEYDVTAYVYHPLDCLQAVITSKESNRIDVMAMNDMIAQITS